jgi:hypothetical protein
MFRSVNITSEMIYSKSKRQLDIPCLRSYIESVIAIRKMESGLNDLLLFYFTSPTRLP